MIRLLSVSLVFLSSNTWAFSSIACSYSFEQTPLTTVTLTYAADGTLSPTASYSGVMAGSGVEPVTADVLTAGEMAHVWLDEADPDNALEMIVYDQPTSSGQSELINHNVPAPAQILWGTCTFAGRE